MRLAKQYLVMHDGWPDGNIVDQYTVRRELIRARFHGWYITTIEVSEEIRQDLIEVMDELD